jgi:hypothetical protein
MGFAMTAATELFKKLFDETSIKVYQTYIRALGTGRLGANLDPTVGCTAVRG